MGGGGRSITLGPREVKLFRVGFRVGRPYHSAWLGVLWGLRLSCRSYSAWLLLAFRVGFPLAVPLGGSARL